MSLDAVLSVVADRGLSVVLGPDGRPRVVGPRGEVTPALLDALREYREEILARLAPPAPPPAREWLWRFGQRYAETPDDPRFGDPLAHPVGAVWWRHAGEPGWRPVPGKPCVYRFPLEEGGGDGADGLA